MQLLTHVQLLVNVGGCGTALDQSHMKLYLIRLARRIGQGEGPRAINARQFDIDVLAGLEGHRAVELQADALDGRRQLDDVCDGCGVVLHRIALEVFVDIDIRLDGDVAFNCGTAGQHLAFVPFHIHQGKGRGIADFNIALDDLDLAGGTGAMAAGKRQPDTLAQGGGKDGLAILDLDLLTNGFDSNGVTHSATLRIRRRQGR